MGWHCGWCRCEAECWHLAYAECVKESPNQFHYRNEKEGASVSTRICVAAHTHIHPLSDSIIRKISKITRRMRVVLVVGFAVCVIAFYVLLPT